MYTKEKKQPFDLFLLETNISHAHPDHIGGLTDKDGQITFPKINIWSRLDYKKPIDINCANF